MPIVYSKGEDFWIESGQAAVTIPDAAGSSLSAFNLDKPGVYLGGGVTIGNQANNDNTQAIGSIELDDVGGGLLDIGDNITGLMVQIKKAIGTAGNTVITCNWFVFMRKSRG